MHHGTGNLEPLRHAARVAAHIVVLAVCKAELLEVFVCLLVRIAAGHAEVAGVEDEVLAGCEATVEVVVLRHDADLSTCMHRVLRDRMSVEEYIS